MGLSLKQSQENVTILRCQTISIGFAIYLFFCHETPSWSNWHCPFCRHWILNQLINNPHRYWNRKALHVYCIVFNVWRSKWHSSGNVLPKDESDWSCCCCFLFPRDAAPPALTWSPWVIPPPPTPYSAPLLPATNSQYQFSSLPSWGISANFPLSSLALTASLSLISWDHCSNISRR